MKSQTQRLRQSGIPLDALPTEEKAKNFTEEMKKRKTTLGTSTPMVDIAGSKTGIG